MKVFDEAQENLHLIFEREPKTGLTIWAVFDTNTRTFAASGCAVRWDDAAVDAREAMRGDSREAKND